MIITVSGKCAEGKTTLALALEEFLKSKGFTNVSVTDLDVTYQTHYPHLQERRMKVIKDRQVVIETRQDRGIW